MFRNGKCVLRLSTFLLNDLADNLQSIILWSTYIDRWSPAAEDKRSCFDLQILMLG